MFTFQKRKDEQPVAELLSGAPDQNGAVSPAQPFKINLWVTLALANAFPDATSHAVTSLSLTFAALAVAAPTQQPAPLLRAEEDRGGPGSAQTEQLPRRVRPQLQDYRGGPRAQVRQVRPA